jgi:hypothetical protein
VNNYLILNYFYTRIDEDINTKLINIYPKQCIIDSVHIFSKNYLLGNFVIIEKLVRQLAIKFKDLNMKEISYVIVSCLRAKFVDKNLFDKMFENLISSNMFTINYITIRNLKTLLERFVTEDYKNEKLITESLKIVQEKLTDLRTFLPNYNNIEFVEYLRKEMLTTDENIIYETITQLDFEKYINLCKTIELLCLFKTHQYEVISADEIKIENKIYTFRYL